jgi:hypothetical protein
LDERFSRDVDGQQRFSWKDPKKMMDDSLSSKNLPK